MSSLYDPPRGAACRACLLTRTLARTMLTGYVFAYRLVSRMLTSGQKTLEQTIPVHGPPGTASYASLAAPWRSALVVVRGAGLRPLPPARKRAAAIAKAQANFLSVEAVRRLSARGFEYYLVVLDGDAAAAAGKARRKKEIPCRARGTGAGAGPAGTRWVPVPLSPKDAAKFPTAAEQKDLCYWLVRRCVSACPALLTGC
jgi:hypothetical protein